MQLQIIKLPVAVGNGSNIKRHFLDFCSFSCVSLPESMVSLRDIYLTIIVVTINANFTDESMTEENSVIDLNDILSEKLMPASLFFMNNPVERDVVSEFRTLDNETSIDSTTYDGTFNKAYTTMGFHR